MGAAEILLLFAICRVPEPEALDGCEYGQVAAPTCAAAERYLRAGLRPGQVLHVWECGAVREAAASRRLEGARHD